MDGHSILEQLLKDTLRRIKAHDEGYDERYRLVLIAVSLANQLGMKAGFRLDPAAPEWPCAYIHLPTGQVSWHCPQFPDPWDGHTVEEKYRRIDTYAPDDAVPLERLKGGGR
jgi:hypothetical protein